MKSTKTFIFTITLALLLASCEKNENTPLSLETKSVELTFPTDKTVEIFGWAGDKAKVIAESQNQDIVQVALTDMKNGVTFKDRLFLSLYGDANVETTVIVSDEKGNRAHLAVKSANPYYAFKEDETVRIELNDDNLKIDQRKGDAIGGTYTFGREADIATFKWQHEPSGKAVILSFTETCKDGLLTTGKKMDAVLKVINPQARNEADKNISIPLSHLSVFSMKGTVDTTGKIHYHRAWILFRLPAKQGQDKGTLGYCVVELQK